MRKYVSELEKMSKKTSFLQCVAFLLFLLSLQLRDVLFENIIIIFIITEGRILDLFFFVSLREEFRTSEIVTINDRLVCHAYKSNDVLVSDLDRCSSEMINFP